MPQRLPAPTRRGRRGPLRPVVLAATLATTAALAVLPVTSASATPAPAAPAAPVDRAVAPAAHVVPAALPAPAARPALAALPAAAKAAATRSSAVQNALGKVGSPYRWGATGPNSFDCSGLVNWAYEQEGVDLPRTSRALASAGTPVSRSALRPGDLVTFYRPVSHVGIYVGDGRIVHASTSGSPVKVSDMDRMPFNSARRI